MVQNLSPIENASHRVRAIIAKHRNLHEFLNQCWKSKPTERPKAQTLLNHKFLRLTTPKTMKKKSGKTGVKGKKSKKLNKKKRL